LFDTTQLLLFMAACMVMLISPGPAVLYIVSRTLDQGYRSGFASIFGLAFGSLFHVAATALGLSVILAASATAFSIIKYAGAGYLIYLGIRRLMTRPTNENAAGNGNQVTASRAFWQGAVVNLFNPKAILFFLAFLPQFVDVSRGHVSLQLAALGLILTAMGLVSDTIYVLLAGTLRKYIIGRDWFAWLQRYFTGFVYIGLGVLAAVSGSSKK
jgi:threonine/homoserine/homoserine lactone efflux protein